MWCKLEGRARWRETFYKELYKYSFIYNVLGKTLL